MRVSSAVVCILLSLTANLFAQSDDSTATLSGNWRYVIEYGSESIMLSGDSIVNNGAIPTGKLRLALYFVESTYEGGSLSGWNLGEYALNPLDSGYQYERVDAVVPMKKQPKSGTYHVTLLLLQQKGSIYGIVDHVNFPGVIDFTNTAEKKIDGLLGQLRIEQANYDFYLSGIKYQYDLTMILSYQNNALTALAKVTQIKSQLGSLGYYVDSPYLNSYLPSVSSLEPYFTLKSTDVVNSSVVPPAYVPVIPYGYDSPTVPGGTGSSSQAKLSQLEKNLSDAEQRLESVQRQYDTAVSNNSGVLVLTKSLLQAQDYVKDCERLLKEARGY